MNPRTIRASLILHGISQAAIARRFNISEAAVSRVIYGQSRSVRVQEAIAEAIKLPFEQVWGPRGLTRQLI